MVREKDVCWEYCERLEGNKVRCKFCLKVLNGGISRMKFHLSRLPSKGVHPCSKVRDEVADRVKSIIAMKEEEKEVSNAKKQRLGDGNSPGIVSTPKTLVVVPAETTAKLFPSDAERCVAEFFFENKLDFSVARSSSYQIMLESLGGPGFAGPTVDSLRTGWLPKLKSEVTSQVKEMEKDWSATGCSIMADTWTDNKSRALINFYVSYPLGTFFHKSVDASSYFKNARYLCDLFDSVIQDFGPENVVQVIVDNSLNYACVGNHILQSYGSIFWSPCASHCLDLILEDFSRIDWVNRCILQAQTVTRFIYNNARVLELMRKFAGGGQELVRCGVTRPTSSFLTLQSLLRQKSRLKHMFNSPEYSTFSYSNRSPSLSCIDIVEDVEFWRAVEEIASVSEPLLKVLRDVAGGKPAVGSVYESMTRAKESIRTYYIMDEIKCKTFLDIVDRRWQNQLHSPLHAAAAFLNPSIQYNPEVKFLGIVKEEFFTVLERLLPTPELRHDLTTQICIFRKAQGMFASNLAKEARNNTPPGMWWEQYGDSAPGLQRVAVRILNQVCSSLALDRNWSSFQQIHFEKRNKLEKEALSDLLYVHCNMKLKAKAKSPEADPIILDEIDMASEWVEEAEIPATTQWLDRFSSALDGGDLNTRQFSNSIFGPNDHLFNL